MREQEQAYEGRDQLVFPRRSHYPGMNKNH